MSAPRALTALGALLAFSAAAPRAQVAELAKLAPSIGGAPQALCGASAAVDGDRAVVGAPGKQDEPAAPGRAYVFERDAAGAWSQFVLFPGDSVASDHFGRSVAIDGERALIGAPVLGLAGPKPGRAYVFERDPSGAWTQRALLMGSDTVQGDEFATAVALSGDRALVGAYHQNAPQFMSGAAYVFERQPGGAWSQVAKLTNTSSSDHDYFGYTVALDGERALVTATGDAAPGPAPALGAAFVFERQASGSWLEVAVLHAHDGVLGATFGDASSLAGGVALIGTYSDGDLGFLSGAAYVYERQPGGAWPETAKLHAGDGEDFDFFGVAVAVDGARAVIGAHGDHDVAAQTATGSAYLFERQPSGAWAEIAKILASDEPGTDSIGQAVAISGDRVVLGARYDDPAGPKSGSAYAFDVEPLSALPAAISVSAGGAQQFRLEAGHAHAAQPYLVLGSAGGSVPGVALPGGLVLPLNPDGYFQFTLAHPNQPPLAGSLGFLDSAGRGAASFGLPPGSDPALVGLEARHAFAVLGLPSLSVVFASNAAAAALVP